MTQKQDDNIEEAPRRYDVELFIVHPTIDPTEITVALELEPQHSWRVGASRQTPKGTPLPGVYPDTRWRHSRRYTTHDQWFAGAVADLIATLIPHKEYLLQLRATGGKTCLVIQFLDDAYLGDEISRETLARIVELGLDLSLENF